MPGFIDTPMTRGRVDPSSPLLASPERVARTSNRGDPSASTLYTPWILGAGILAIIRRFPNRSHVKL